MRTLHLHIGMPKTASTWLQDRVFPALPHLAVRSMPRTTLFRTPGDARAENRVLGCVVRRAPSVWDAMGDRILDVLEGGAVPPDRSLLVSDEAFGRAASRPQAVAAHLGALRAAAARRGYGRVAVVVLLRRQDTWLASHYAQISDREPRASQAGFEAMVDQMIDPARGRYLAGMVIDYHALVDALHGALGRDDVLALPHEALVTEPEATLRRLLAALDTPATDLERIVAEAGRSGAENRRADGTGRWALRPRRILARGAPGRGIALPGWLARERGRTIALTPALSGRILAAYGRGNAAAAAATGLDLARHGYVPAEGP